jgi:hypothetical protein
MARSPPHAGHLKGHSPTLGQPSVPSCHWESRPAGLDMGPVVGLAEPSARRPEAVASA